VGADEFEPGDTVIHNSPFRGGAHLPDITFVSPVFVQEELRAFVANRAHHADVGGARAGSVAADTTSIYGEGIQIPPVHLFEGGSLNEDVLALLTENVRTPGEREGDLRAQQAANETGRRRFRTLVEKHGLETVERAAAAVQSYSESRMRAAIEELPRGQTTFTDVMDGDGTGVRDIELTAEVTIDEETIDVDFDGSSEQVPGPINAPIAVTTSATYYTVRALTDPDIPPNHGCYRPISVGAPEGSIVNARRPAAVVGGNLELAQRIVDVIVGAMAKGGIEEAIAAPNGSMNNVTFGGRDPDTDEPYTFYETIGGGYGARTDRDGVDGIHAHMTNTQNTPVEALELAYPLRVHRYALRPDTGGAGKYRGGMGIRRDIEVLDHQAEFSLLSERREHAPYGLEGGKPGAPGDDRLLVEGESHDLDGKTTIDLEPGTVVSIRTPGGGGYGSPEDRSRSAIEADLREGRISEVAIDEWYPHVDLDEQKQ
ncbi:MAG: hydantoinase B/oxoprolinase family protein, partial [Halodesulfurarchaeum sp.]